MSEPFVSLLPPSASKLERALERSFKDSLEGINIPIRTLWNPDTCPLSHLPWLAWAFSVDAWEPSWTEEQQRAVVRNSLIIHKYKGTIGAVKTALESIGYQWSIVEWWQDTPKGAPYTFRIDIHVRDRAITDAEYNSILRIIQDTKNVRSKLSTMYVTNDTYGKLYAALGVISGCEDDLYPYMPGEVISTAYITFLSAVLDGETTSIFPFDPTPDTTLVGLNEIEVSMLCRDGSDGKGNAFSLTPLAADGVSDLRNFCTWTSSDPAKATVVNGIVSTALGGYGQVTISCLFKGVTHNCLFTVYGTMPNKATRYTLKGGKGRNIIGNSGDYLCYFANNTVTPAIALGYMRWQGKSQIPALYSTFAITYSGITNGVSRMPMIFNEKPCVRVETAGITERNIQNNRLNVALSGTDPVEMDLAYDESGYYYNGTYYNEGIVTTPDGPYSAQPQATYIVFTDQLDKATMFTANSAALSASDLLDRTKCARMYIPQNYIRYRDSDVRDDYVVIPNIGIQGAAFDVSCNNTPTEWFE